MATIEEVMKGFNSKFKEDLVHNGLPEYDYERIPFTSPRLNYMTFGGLPIGKLIEFSGPEHSGKALAMDCPILTPSGYIPMRDISVGTKVIDGLGSVTDVVGVYPQGQKQMYKITFADHSQIECSGDHLWEVTNHSTYNKVRQTLSTLEILDSYKKIKNGRNFFVYSIDTPIVYDINVNKDLPIDPYLLGLLLGDGGLNDSGIGFSNNEDDILSRMSDLLKSWDMELRYSTSNSQKRKPYDFRIAHKDVQNPKTVNGKTLRQTLTILGLKCKSIDKHIPNEYLFTSVENRIKLLQGLVDTDGSVNKSGGIAFYTSSSRLSEDFAFLARSLGCVDMVTSKSRGYRDKTTGEYIQCKDGYTHNLVFRNGIIPCSSKKHLSKYVANRRGSYYRKIVNIEQTDIKECQCIKVSSDCHTFIADNVTVTHNTTSALDIVANYQHMEDARKVLWVDCENTLDFVWANKLNVDVENIILMQPTNQGAEEIFQFMLDMIDTGDVGLVVLDSIGVMVSNQAMEKTVAEKTYGGIAMALTNFSAKAVGLCHRHKCTLIAINQLRDDLDSMFGGTKTVGGRAWKHDTSVRIEFRMGKYFDANGNDLNKGAENPAGNYVLATMVKNKTCPPLRRQGFYTLNYLTGIDYFKDLVEIAIKENMVVKSGAWYAIVDSNSGEELAKVQGVNKVYDYLEQHEETLKMIEDKVSEKINEIE